MDLKTDCVVTAQIYAGARSDHDKLNETRFLAQKSLIDSGSDFEAEEVGLGAPSPGGFLLALEALFA